MLVSNACCSSLRLLDCDPGRTSCLIGTGRGLRYALWISAALGLGGCAGPGRDAGVVELASCPRPYESDIPLPQGFELVDGSSEDWSSGPIRYLRHRYVGRADKYAVRKFYRGQMPLVKWTALAESQVHGRYRLRFKRGNESCTIVITDAGSRLFPRAAVDVIIGPMTQE